MKKTIAISLFIFSVVIIGIFVGSLVFNGNSNNGVDNSNTKILNNTNATNQNNPIKTTNATQSIKPKLNIAEVAKHNQINDCYMIINGKVYDLTSYASAHPGGTRTIANSCGTEATQAYDTKGGYRGPHSSYASSLLDKYFVGNLVQ